MPIFMANYKNIAIENYKLKLYKKECLERVLMI